jgi:hypothetical protein
MTVGGIRNGTLLKPFAPPALYTYPMPPTRLFLRALSTAAFAIALLLVLPCQAQWGAAATVSLAHTQFDSSSNDVWLYGPTFSVQHESGYLLKFGFDARAAFLRNGNDGVNAGDIGPRIAVRLPILHIEPYGEFLIGYMGARDSSSDKFTTHVDAQLLGGIDFPLVPHFALRLEYSSAGIFYLSSLDLGGGGEDGRRQISFGLLAHL